MAVIATVATRPLATLAARAPPATSIWDSTQPPKISPLPFMSAGCGTVLMIGSRGFRPSNSHRMWLIFKRFSYHTHVVPATKRSPRAAEERQEAAMAKNGDLFDRSGGKRAAATKDNSYTARDIEVLEGLEPVRKRPGMYIGGTDERALHHLVAEVLDNAMDEAVAGHADTIHLELLSGNRVLVRDNGRGIPVDPHPKFKNKSALEVILTTLHSGGKFNSKVYATSGGLHGVGVSVVNALSDELVVEVARDRQAWTQSFSRGKPVDQAEIGRPRPQPARHDRHLPSRSGDLRQAGLRARAALPHGALQGLSVPRRRDPLEMRQAPAAQGRHDPRGGSRSISRAG